jgi:hypothetical protein
VTTISLSDDEALVLFEFLSRVTDAHGFDANQEKRLWTVIDHPAEFWALNSVQGALEKILVLLCHKFHLWLLRMRRTQCGHR